jgi:hypothetical protein
LIVASTEHVIRPEKVNEAGKLNPFSALSNDFWKLFWRWRQSGGTFGRLQSKSDERLLRSRDRSFSWPPGLYISQPRGETLACHLPRERRQRKEDGSNIAQRKAELPEAKKQG